jgi:hypothetical protein
MLKTDAKETDSATNLKHPLQMQASDSISFSTAAGPQEKGLGKFIKPISRGLGRVIKPVATIIKPFVPILGPVSNALQIAQQVKDLKRKD